MESEPGKLELQEFRKSTGRASALGTPAVSPGTVSCPSSSLCDPLLENQLGQGSQLELSPNLYSACGGAGYLYKLWAGGGLVMPLRWDRGCHTELILRVLSQLCIWLSPGMQEPAARGVWFWTSQSEPDVEEENRGASDQLLFSLPFLPTQVIVAVRAGLCQAGEKPVSTPGWGSAPASQGAAAGVSGARGGCAVLLSTSKPPARTGKASGGVLLLPVARLAPRLGLVVR